MGPLYNEDPVITNNIWKPGRITVKYVELTNNEPRYNEQILTVPTHNLPRYNEYFVLSLALSKNNMMIQMVDRPNTTPIGQTRETLTFKALLYLNVAVHAQVCRLFCVLYIPLVSLVQLGHPAITNTFVVNQIIRYNGVFTITKTPL